MLIRVSGLVALFLLVSTCLSAASVKGKVVDPSGAAIGGAQIALTNRVGVVARATSAPSGAFEIAASDLSDAALVVTAPGFAMRTVPLDEAATVTLDLAPRVDS